jgi:hypothetical protein
VKVCFLIGSPEIGGGTYVIYEHALYLQQMGWDITIVPIWPPNRESRPWHRAVEQLKFATIADVASEEFDLAVATWWRTIYDLLPQIRARRSCYFVQSIESWFYLNSDVAVRNLVNSTYLLPMPGITEARWIKAHLAERFAHDYHLAPNGCRKDDYRVDGPVVAPRQAGRLRVLVEGPLGVDFKNVARTITLARRSAADEIWLLTSSPVSYFPGVDRVFSRVPTSDCASIYRSCDVLLKLSTIEGMFGPPLEMFHCGGTAIVYDVSGYDEYIIDQCNAIVVRIGEEKAVVEAINRLREDPVVLARLKGGALATAKAWPDWAEASARFAEALRAILAAPPVDHLQLLSMVSEFWAQYLRAEKYLRRSRGKNRLFKALAFFGRCFPRLVGHLQMVYAHFAESRRHPPPRERI